MNILFIGDIVGSLGKESIKHFLPKLIDKYEIDFTIANGENISSGKGMTETDFLFLVNTGVDVITLGNHFHAKQQIDNYIDDECIVRPLNLLNYNEGEGSRLYDVDGKKIRVTSLLGNAFMPCEIISPYQSILEVIQDDTSDIHIIDFHGEATAEKKCFAYYLKDKVSALFGTHTHVQTNDDEILDGEIAYISDVGMCGAKNSVIGANVRSSIERTIFNNKDARLSYDNNGSFLFNGVVLSIDDLTLKPTKLVKIREEGNICEK